MNLITNLHNSILNMYKYIYSYNDIFIFGLFFLNKLINDNSNAKGLI